jgi:hypothetical protein
MTTVNIDSARIQSSTWRASSLLIWSQQWIAGRSLYNQFRFWKPVFWRQHREHIQIDVEAKGLARV